MNIIYQAKGKTEFKGVERGNSIWADNISPEKYTMLLKGKKDVIIIGGGLAGMLTAYRLVKRGLNVVVLEANRIGHGMTMNTTAKITSQHGLIYDKLIQTQGIELASQYMRANEAAIDEFEAIIKEEKISCNFERKTNYVYTLEDEAKIEREKRAVEHLHGKADLTANLKLPFPVKLALSRKEQAQYHPLKFLEAITERVPVIEGIEITSISEEGVVESNVASFHADHIVIATHYPIINAPGYYFLKIHQERSYLMCLEDIDHPEKLDIDGMYIDENINGLTFRNYEKYLIFGGGNHRTGSKQEINFYGNLLRYAGEYYPNAGVVSTWSNQDCMTPDGIPYIGRYSKKFKNIYVATGFNQWGMSSSMVAADIISDMICEKQNDCEEVFSPQRRLKRSIGKLTKHVSITTIALSKEWLRLPSSSLKKIKRGEAGIVKIDGKRIGVYHDSNGTYYYVSTKCPHLGCSLKWNKNEATWDCPCHGSRFDFRGNLLSNPASRSTFIGCKK